jgi:integrase
MRAKHLSLRTERAYLGWMRRYILFHGKRHPGEMGESEINAFLTHLAVERRISASTQTQALCALLYLYREILEKPVGELEGLIRAKRRRRLPVVLTREEVRRVLAQVEGTEHLFLTLLYGTGLRLVEGLRLRVKDVDFAENQITVRDGKGAKDRVTMLPASIQDDGRGGAESARPVVMDRRRGVSAASRAQKPSRETGRKLLPFLPGAGRHYAAISAYDQLYKLPFPPRKPPYRPEHIPYFGRNSFSGREMTWIGKLV